MYITLTAAVLMISRWNLPSSGNLLDKKLQQIKCPISSDFMATNKLFALLLF